MTTLEIIKKARGVLSLYCRDTYGIRALKENPRFEGLCVGKALAYLEFAEEQAEADKDAVEFAKRFLENQMEDLKSEAD